MKDLNFCINHDGTDTSGLQLLASSGPGSCRKLPLDAAFGSMLRADIENDCSWLASVGIMDYSLLVGIGHLEFQEAATPRGKAGAKAAFDSDIECSVVASPQSAEAGVDDESAGQDACCKKPAAGSEGREKTSEGSKNDASPAKTPRRLSRRQLSLHSDLQLEVQTVPWKSVWQEHWGGVSCVYSDAHVASYVSCAPPASCRQRRVVAGEPAIIYLGIVDILQEYNLIKRFVSFIIFYFFDPRYLIRMETAYKMRLHAAMGYDPYLISALDADSYSQRFRNFISNHV
jgi:hypothetical protein